MNKANVLETFGQIIIKSVRDEVLDINELILSGKMGGKENLDLHAKVSGLSENDIELVRAFARQAVDSTLHYFLWMIEQNEEYELIKYTDDKGQFISLRDISDGLCGELYTEEGWIETYSQYPPS